MSSLATLLRRGAKREPKPRYLIVCEGAKTEPIYLEAMNAHWGNAIVLDIQHRYSSPKQIVESAVERKKAAVRKAKNDPNEAYEEIWVVFDRDEHPLVGEALHQAEANGLGIAFSAPSFELWFALHFQHQTAYLTRQDARRLCQTYMTG